MLLVACIETGSLLAMDLENKENHPHHNHLAPQAPQAPQATQAANHPIVMTVGDQTKSFSSWDEAHAWFSAMARYQKAARLTEKWNAENE